MVIALHPYPSSEEYTFFPKLLKQTLRENMGYGHPDSSRFYYFEKSVKTKQLPKALNSVITLNTNRCHALHHIIDLKIDFFCFKGRSYF